MKRLLLLTLLLPLIVWAEQRTYRTYGEGTTVEFELYAADGTLSVSEVDGGTEVTIVCDGDAGTTATNDFVDEGFAYSLVLTAAELECAHVTLNVAATLNHAVIIETCGSPNAAHDSCPTGLPVITAGTAQAGSTATTTVLASAETFADDDLNGYLICQVEDMVAGNPKECQPITDYTGSTDTATHGSFVAAVPTGGEYTVFADPRAPINVSNGVIEANATQAEGSDWTDQVDARLTAYDAATGTEMATAQADLDLLTGTDGATLATAQANYAPATASALTTHDGKLDTVDANVDLVLADTGTDGVVVGTGAIGPSEVATGAIDADALAADAIDEIWDEVIETAGSTYTARCINAISLAYAAGTWSTSGSVSTFKDPGGNTNRIVGTITGSSRGSITITCP